MKNLFLLFSFFVLVACDSKNDSEPFVNDNPKILSAKASFQNSTPLGNFVATAIQRANNLDFVFVPSTYINKNKAAYIDLNMSNKSIEEVVNLFGKGPEDIFLKGTMKGKSIKEFLINRSREKYATELETAGLWYHIGFYGGILTSTNFSVDGRYKLEDERYYTIAVSDDFYFGFAFPGYKYRNGFNFHFKRSKYEISLRNSIRTYLKEAREFPSWIRERAKVERVPSLLNAGYKEIHKIQGARHASPLLNQEVTTQGVITALGHPDWYPFGTEFYIESLNPDQDPKTSEALHVHTFSLDTFGLNLKRGDLIEISGTVYEDIRVNGMGDTTLRFIKNIKLLKEDQIKNLPAPAYISRTERNLPTKSISTYGGRLMEKTFLNLDDGIDFWESLEGMRVKFDNPVVLGFRGGREDYYEKSSKTYLNLYITPQDFLSSDSQSHKGGLMIKEQDEDFNPEVVNMITNHLTHTKNLDEEKYYTVGDVFEGPVEGVVIYNKNIFGGGEYAIVVPTEQETLSKSSIKKTGKVDLKDRPRSAFDTENPDELVIATYNLENLSAFQINKHGDDRMQFMAKSIIINLKCPDILNLVEIQDNNGIDFRGSQDAEVTIRRLRSFVQSSCLHQDYDFIEIEPFLHGEGGQPGGNIRVSILYNRNKVFIEERSDGAYGRPAVVEKGGQLSNNPGRIYPLNSAFRRSRRSLVVEFSLVKNPSEKVYLIGNHLNSKLGDMDFWGNQQIARANSDDKRGQKTALINKFIHWLEDENPSANIVVLGDFNALSTEGSMKILSDGGKTLQNMIFTLPENMRYTTNHNGSSQPLDYVFVNNHIKETKDPVAEILHINSDYMAKLSDHDPVLLRLSF